jgi:hypothetical protein
VGFFSREGLKRSGLVSRCTFLFHFESNPVIFAQVKLEIFFVCLSRFEQSRFVHRLNRAGLKPIQETPWQQESQCQRDEPPFQRRDLLLAVGGQTNFRGLQRKKPVSLGPPTCSSIYCEFLQTVLTK